MGTALGKPRPALAVGHLGLVGVRHEIVIHPAHEPDLFLSSVGCINLTGPLAGGQEMDAADSRARVIALIDLLRANRPEAFHSRQATEFVDARGVVLGEPA